MLNGYNKSFWKGNYSTVKSSNWFIDQFTDYLVIAIRFTQWFMAQGQERGAEGPKASSLKVPRYKAMQLYGYGIATMS